MLLLFFLIRTIVCRKKFFIEKNSFFCGRGCKNYGSTYRAHMTAHVIWVDEICQCSDVYQKHQ